jgi:ABC-type phosphate transport system substrate-binding protein
MMCCLALAYGLVICASAQAQISVIVAKSAAHTPSENDIKSYFSAVKFNWPDGKKVQVVDQPDTEVAQAFYSKFLGKTVALIRKEWTKLILSGQAAAPIKCANDEAVKTAVSSNPNAIGIISSSALDGTVKEIIKIQ